MQSDRPAADAISGEEPSNDGGPSKRRRIAVACKSCRSRKSRCNGDRPSCSLCSELGTACIYELPAKVRRPESDVPQRRDENGAEESPTSKYHARLSAIEGAVRELLQRSMASPHAADPLTGPAVQQATGKDTQTTELGSLPEDYSSVDGMAAVTASAGTEDRFFGPSSNIAFMQGISRAASSVLRTTGVRNQSVNGTYPLVSRVQSPAPFQQAIPPRVPPQTNPFTMPSPSQGLHLLKLYFSDTGLIYPFINEQQVFKAYDNFSKNHTATVSRSWLGLFNAIFAFATYISATPTNPVTVNMEQADVFFNRAVDLVCPSALRLPDICSVQTLQLLAQYCQGTQRADEGWMLHGLAVRAALQLGLHCPPKDTPAVNQGLSTRRRTWFACLALDRTLSMTFGRPLNISEFADADIERELAVVHNVMPSNTTIGDNSFGSPDTTCFLVTTVRLYRILAQVLKQVYQDNASETVQPTSTKLLGTMLVIEDQLEAFRSVLPAPLASKPWLNSPVQQQQQHQQYPTSADPADHHDQAFSRLSVVTQLRFLNVRLLLHRIVLDNLLKAVSMSLSSSSSSAGQAEQSTTTTQRDVMATDFSSSSLAICQACAMEIITIIHTMSRSKSLLGAWWFSVYYTFNASLVIFGSLLLGLSCVRQSHPGLHVLDNERMTASRRMSQLAKHLRDAILTVDLLENDTKLVQRIRRIMVRSIQVCTALARTDDPTDLAIVNALRGNSSSGNNNGENYGAAAVVGSTTLNTETQDLQDPVTLKAHTSNSSSSGLPPRNHPPPQGGGGGGGDDFALDFDADMFDFFTQADDADIFGTRLDDEGLINLFAI